MKRKGLGITCLAAAATLVCLTGIYAVAGKGAKAPAAETEESGEAANIVVAEEAEENRSESEERDVYKRQICSCWQVSNPREGSPFEMTAI